MSSPIENKLERQLGVMVKTLGWSLQRQVRHGAYTLDFLVSIQGRPVVVIECDGFEWHERTKEQAAKDRRRDRDVLRILGIPTLRFLGSEIAANAEACATSVIVIARRLAGIGVASNAEEHW